MDNNLLSKREKLMQNAGLSETDLRNRSKLPKFEKRALEAGFNETDAVYKHSLKSDSVHGGWATLRIFHLDFAD